MNLQNRDGFLTYAGGFLFVLLLVTMALAVISGVEPWDSVHWRARDVALGTLAAIGMMAAFSVFTPIRRQAQDILGPALARCRWYDLIVLAVLVGILEELLFRGVLEQWISRFDPWLALLAVNAVFGLLHAVSWGYALLAMTLGCLLSLLAAGPGDYNLLRPIVAHAVYDYLGFLWIAAATRKSADFDSPPDHPPDDSNESTHAP